jgi:hypothetical protein
MRISAMLRAAAAVCAVAILYLSALVITPAMTAQESPAAAAGDVVLKAADTQKLLPPSVYYKGQTATTQLRNSGGVKFADGYYVLASLVDTSGYSTDIQQKYAAYFIAEVPIKIGGQALPAGVYGAGFVAGDKFVITDVGAHEVLSVDSQSDAGLKRPMPLQVIADPAGGYRLYAGRRYVVMMRSGS